MKQIIQRGAIDSKFLAAMAVIFVAGGFVLYQITYTNDLDESASTDTALEPTDESDEFFTKDEKEPDVDVDPEEDSVDEVDSNQNVEWASISPLKRSIEGSALSIENVETIFDGAENVADMSYLKVSFRIDNNSGKRLEYSSQDFSFTKLSNKKMYDAEVDVQLNEFVSSTIENGEFEEGFLIFVTGDDTDAGTLTWSPPRSQESTAFRLSKITL